MAPLPWLLCAVLATSAAGARVGELEQEQQPRPRRGVGKQPRQVGAEGELDLGREQEWRHGSSKQPRQVGGKKKQKQQHQQESPRARLVEAFGAPTLEVLSTSNDTEAAAFLEEWSAARKFGLFLQLVPDSRGFFPRRAGLVGIARGARVLLFDLRPHLQKDPRPLPQHLGRFLADERRTFFGLGLRDAAAHLVFEPNAVARFVDYRVRGWKPMPTEGSLLKLAKLYFGLNLSKRPSLRELKVQALLAYLEWAVVEHFMAFYGKAEESRMLKGAELFAHRPRSVRAQNPGHEWEKATEEWLRLKEERSAERLRKAQELQWYWEPEDARLQGREMGIGEEGMNAKGRLQRVERKKRSTWAK